MKKLADQFLEDLKDIPEAKEIGSEEEIFGKNLKFEEVIERILGKIEKRSKAQQAKLYRELLDRFLANLVGSPIADRKLLSSARDFWRYGFQAHADSEE